MIQVRLVADDVDELRHAADAIGQVLDIAYTSRPVPRRSGDGVSLYLRVELPELERSPRGDS